MTTPETDHPAAAPDPYSQDSPCPKCGSLAVTTEMCIRTQDLEALAVRMIWPAACWWDAWLLPHLHRDCKNCGHRWFQRPLDADPDDYTADSLAGRIAGYERREGERKRELEKWNSAVAAALEGGAKASAFTPDEGGRTRWLRRRK